MSSNRTRRLVACSAAAVFALTACSSSEGGGDPETSSATVSNGDAIAVTGTAALKWDPPSLAAEAGEVTFSLTSEGATHNIILEELDDLLVVQAELGQTASAAIGLDAGEYTFYCNITGHRAAGMEGTLTVS